MFAQAASGAVIGVDAHAVTVECHRANGLPGMVLIGMARGAVKEAVVRVRSAITATGIALGSSRLVANMLPAELPKEASALDLALAVALLAVHGVVPVESLLRRRFFGELSLGGTVEGVRGAVLVADLARRHQDREVLVAQENGEEAAIIPGVRVVAVRHLRDVVDHLLGERPIAASLPPQAPASRPVGCFSEVRGQAPAKQALQIAAAGGHNILMTGPPGSGKTMLARRLPGLMPDLSAEESIEVTRIQSAAGPGAVAGLVRQRPFRAPHHTASEVALCGGGSIPRPGEITLAHRGVLFLDELPEFSRRALESLREPLEEGFIHIARAAKSLRFPADVLLVAALNPCPCGYFVAGSRPSPRAHPCLCSFEQIQRYRARISGPLLDRIDLHVGVEAVPYRELLRAGTGETSGVLRERVVQARQAQAARLGAARTNAQMTPAELQAHVPLPPQGLQAIEAAMHTHGLSSRAVGRILKVARTVADLQKSRTVSTEHIEQAIGFRLLDRRSAPPQVSRGGAGHF